MLLSLSRFLSYGYVYLSAEQILLSINVGLRDELERRRGKRKDVSFPFFSLESLPRSHPTILIKFTSDRVEHAIDFYYRLFFNECILRFRREDGTENHWNNANSPFDTRKRTMETDTRNSKEQRHGFNLNFSNLFNRIFLN